MQTPGEFRQIELMNSTLRRIADALETIAKSVAPDSDDPEDAESNDGQ